MNLQNLKVEDIKEIEIQPYPVIPQGLRRRKYYIELIVKLNNNNKPQSLYSKKEEIPFFHDANHLLYQFEYRNIQDIMQESIMDDDIYNLFTYLWNRNKRWVEPYFGNNLKLSKPQKQKNLQQIVEFIKNTDNFSKSAPTS
jgi:hypothetical protein